MTEVCFALSECLKDFTTASYNVTKTAIGVGGMWINRSECKHNVKVFSTFQEVYLRLDRCAHVSPTRTWEVARNIYCCTKNKSQV